MVSLIEAADKLRKLGALPVGWNYGMGGPLSGDAHILALVTLRFLDSISASKIDVLPSSDGGATLLACFGSDFAEITIKKDGVFDLFLEGSNELELEGADFGGLLGALEGAGWKSPKSSGSQTHFFTVKSTNASPAKRSRKMARVRQLSPLDVHWQPQARCVTILKNTTEELEESPRFSYESQQKKLIMAHG